MAVITAIPATIIGTFYGMNITLPGAINSNQESILGEYTTFILVILASIIPAGLMFAYFKKLGWMG